MAKAKVNKGSWVVRCRCEVVKEIVVVDCTEEQARSDPYEHAIDENEVYQEDWKVLSVEPNE